MASDPKRLAELLAAARERPMTADERREQAVSFVFGQLMDAQPDVTKDEIRKRLFGGNDGK